MFDLFFFACFFSKIGWKLQSYGLPWVASRLSTIPYRLGVMSTVSLQWQSSGGKLMHQENGLFAAQNNSKARPDTWLPPLQYQGSHAKTTENTRVRQWTIFRRRSTTPFFKLRRRKRKSLCKVNIESINSSCSLNFSQNFTIFRCADRARCFSLFGPQQCSADTALISLC